jgi:hypothetical protein
MSAAAGTFVPDPTWPPIIELAIKLWGKPNKRLSKPDDIRFGSKGSKSVTPSKNLWHDYETGDGGGYVEMHRAVLSELPKTKANGKATNGKLPPWQDIDTTYNYTDANGLLILQVVRTISGEPRFRQRKPIGNGRWQWSVRDIPGHDRLLYRLPGLRASGDEWVWVCEGEKDADNLHDAGLIATTNIGGAGKWRDEYAGEFRGKHIIVLQDNYRTTTMPGASMWPPWRNRSSASSRLCGCCCCQDCRQRVTYRTGSTRVARSKSCNGWRARRRHTKHPQ